MGPQSKSGLGRESVPAVSGAQFRNLGSCLLGRHRRWCVCCFLSSSNILHLLLGLLSRFSRVQLCATP